jgi:hypothetical protein
MGCVKLHILDEQYKRTEFKVSYSNKKLTSNFFAENLRSGMLVNAIDPDGRSTWVMANSDGTYRVVGGDLNDKDLNIYVYSIQDDNLVRGKSIGITSSSTSFYNDTKDGDGKELGWMGTINPTVKKIRYTIP